jgi:hypothetical protein
MPNSDEFRRLAASYYEYTARAENSSVRADRRRIAAALLAKAYGLESDQYFLAAWASNRMTAGIGKQKAAA